jgi:hypothetical protein
VHAVQPAQHARLFRMSSRRIIDPRNSMSL